MDICCNYSLYHNVNTYVELRTYVRTYTYFTLHLFIFIFIINDDDKECSKAIEYIKDNYIKLTRGLPIDDLLPNLYGKKVVNDVQKEDIHMKKSRKDKVSYLFDNVVIPELDIGASTKYNNLIKVMEASDDTTAKHLAKLLKGT